LRQPDYTDFHVDGAKTMRADYSALLYLDTEGEDFYGAEWEFFDKMFVPSRTIIKPVAGRLVLFTAGHENVHGVAPISSGSRRVIAAWFSCN
jgi:Rps23 Pro-64 3,4-dihydroxylase Tpa1-like proline 4-hydroxylase